MFVLRPPLELLPTKNYAADFATVGRRGLCPARGTSFGEVSMVGIALLVILALAPSSAPTTASEIDRLRRDRDVAVAAVAAAERELAARIESDPEVVVAAADVAAKLQVLEKARASGTPEERIQAGSDYNRARDRLAKLRAQKLAADQTLPPLRAMAEKCARQYADAVAQEEARADALAREAKAARRRELAGEYRRSMERPKGEFTALGKVPLKGDETPLAAIKADPAKFLGREFIICGGVRVGNYYNYGWDGAQATHYSLRFLQVDREGKPGDSAHMYLNRGLGSDVADVCAAADAAKSGGTRVMRLRVILPRRSASDGEIQADMLEVLDWQFLMPGGADWGPWFSEVRQAP